MPSGATWLVTVLCSPTASDDPTKAVTDQVDPRLRLFLFLLLIHNSV